ncbi:MAG: hypothetical protein H6Q18_572 [Bacteroidetes bacterium]|nr:hypothetical protein [Bacteroidota bacterium]
MFRGYETNISNGKKIRQWLLAPTLAVTLKKTININL